MICLPSQVNTALTLLEGAGHEACVVGGAVRDLLRGAEVHDWDMATSALPEETEAAFSGFPVLETGRKHGTVTVLLDGMPLEITTYRVEGAYSDHRRPDASAAWATWTGGSKRTRFVSCGPCALPPCLAWRSRKIPPGPSTGTGPCWAMWPPSGSVLS